MKTMIYMITNLGLSPGTTVIMISVERECLYHHPAYSTRIVVLY